MHLIKEPVLVVIGHDEFKLYNFQMVLPPTYFLFNPFVSTKI